LGLVLAALCMIAGGLVTDLIGIAIAALIFVIQLKFRPAADAQIAVRGSD
ncbi:hypothetical protein LCGC14_1771210, partial [marine sediment metagenome]